MFFVSIPKGYPHYTHIDFAKYFELNQDKARKIEIDYLALLQFRNQSDFAKRIYDAGRNQLAIRIALDSRYGLHKKQTVALVQFFSAVTNTRKNTVRSIELGITRAIWLSSYCWHPLHIPLNGTPYLLKSGMLINGQFLHPGVAIKCLCTCKPVIPGFATN